MNTTIRTEVTASYNGQTNFTAHVFSNGGEVGHLDYVVFRDEPSVSFISVESGHRRQGVGRLLLQFLQAQFPGQQIDFGMTSSDGSKLIAAISRQEAVLEVVAKKRELQDVRKELAELNERSEAFHLMETRSPHDLEHFRTWIASVSDHWNALHDRASELDHMLNGTRPLRESKTLVNIDPQDWPLLAQPITDIMKQSPAASTLLSDDEQQLDWQEIQIPLNDLPTALFCTEPAFTEPDILSAEQVQNELKSNPPLLLIDELGNLSLRHGNQLLNSAKYMALPGAVVYFARQNETPIQRETPK